MGDRAIKIALAFPSRHDPKPNSINCVSVEDGDVSTAMPSSPLFGFRERDSFLKLVKLGDVAIASAASNVRLLFAT